MKKKEDISLSSEVDQRFPKFKKKVAKEDSLKKDIKEFRLQVSAMSYEDSLNCLESILHKLQNTEVHLDEIQRNYIEGSIYLEHCESLLDDFEQKVQKITPDKLNKLIDE